MKVSEPILALSHLDKYLMENSWHSSLCFSMVFNFGFVKYSCLKWYLLLFGIYRGLS